MSRSVVLLGVAGLLLVTVVPVRGQTTDPINASLQFNFSNPGARSLGLAGAFTARADDATAVYANPAGLIQLSQPELSLELRGWEFSSRFLDGGTQVTTDSLDGLDYGQSDARTAGVSFLSALYPVADGRWVFGLFRHESGNYEAEVHSDGGRLVPVPPSTRFVVRPVDGVYRLDVESFGLSAARRLTASLSLGATVTFSRFELDSRVERWNHLRDEPREPDTDDPTLIEGDPEACCRFAERPDIAVYFTQTQEEGDDDDLTLTLGLLWQSPRQVAGAPLVTVGAVYRAGPEFGLLGSAFRQSTRRDFATGRVTRTFESQIDSPQEAPEACRRPDRPGCPGRFKVPDALGLGVSLRPSLRWVIAFDVNRIEYSDLTAEIVDIDQSDSNLGRDTSGLPVQGKRGESGRPADFAIDDGTEVRLGIEYGLYRERSLPDVQLRAGVWFDPDHEMRYVGSDPQLQAVWTRGEDELHWAAGFGLRFRRLQLDAAIDVSDRVNTVSVSSVYYFGR